MKRILFLAAAVLAALARLPLEAQSFPEGDVNAYIDSVDAVILPVNCKARMAVVDTFSSGDDRATEGFFVRKDNKVVWVATAPASQKNFALLRNEDVFWERFAATNKVVKTSATANSRGGETSNLDLTRFNTNLDYTVKYLGEDAVDGKAATCLSFGRKTASSPTALSDCGWRNRRACREEGVLRGFRKSAQVLHGHERRDERHARGDGDDIR